MNAVPLVVLVFVVDHHLQPWQVGLGMSLVLVPASWLRLA